MNSQGLTAEEARTLRRALADQPEILEKIFGHFSRARVMSHLREPVAYVPAAPRRERVGEFCDADMVSGEGPDGWDEYWFCESEQPHLCDYGQEFPGYVGRMIQD